MTSRSHSLVACLVVNGFLAGCGSTAPTTPAATVDPGPPVKAGRPEKPVPVAAAPSHPPKIESPLIGRGPLLEELPGALGKAIDSPEVGAVRRAVPGEPKEARSDDGRLTLFWDNGFSLTFGKDRTLVEARFAGGNSMWQPLFKEKSKPFPGPLPYGLRWDDGPDTVERNLGQPDAPSDAWGAEYMRLGVKLGFVKHVAGPGTRLDEVILRRPSPAGGSSPVPPPPRTPKPVPPSLAENGFPFSRADVEAVLGLPDECAEDFVGYRNRLTVWWPPAGHLDVQVMTTGAGPGTAAKFFASGLFQEAEGNAAMELLRAKGGEKRAGRFEITARGSAVIADAVVMKVSPRSAGGTEDAEVAALVVKLGGLVTRDTTAPGNPVVEVNLGSAEVTDAVLKDLATLRHLARLRLGYGFNLDNRMTDAGAKHLARITSLTHLELGVCQVTDAGMKDLASLRNLTRLDLGRTDVSDAGLKELTRLPNLTSVDLGGRMMTDAGLKELAPLGKLTALSLATTKYATNRASDAGMRDVAKLSGLQRLDLTGTLVTDQGVRELVPLTKLATLYLFDTQVTETGVRELRQVKNLACLGLGGAWPWSGKSVTTAVKEVAALEQLRQLHLRGMELAVEDVRELARLKNLTSLDLSNCRVSDAGVRELSLLEGLAELNLSGSLVTDAGVQELARLPHLARLDVYGTKVTDAGMKAIRQALPKCEIRK